MNTMSTKKLKSEIVVIGGGPAGMFSAGIAADFSHSVTLVEQNPILGKKLNITGKGRCNLTNRCTEEEVMQNMTRNGKFLYSALQAFPPEGVIDFFESHGCPTKTERGNRVFPQSDRARSVTDTLAAFLAEHKVMVHRAKAVELCIEDGRITGVRTTKGTIAAARVLLCTGGCSYPLTGSDGSGYALAEQAGHTIVAPMGSLVPIVEAGAVCSRMAGLALRNVGMKLLRNEKVVYTDFGELEFTSFGMSGPTILSASAHMRQDGCYLVEIEEKLDARILRDVEKFRGAAMAEMLRAMLPAQMIPLVLARAEIPPSQAASGLTRNQRRKLIAVVKHFSVPIAGLRPVEEAIVTAGGIKVSEVNPKTMESKLVKGLYFAGEILDLDAYTGGFNLQIAWSTAHAAAVAAGNSLESMVY